MRSPHILVRSRNLHLHIYYSHPSYVAELRTASGQITVLSSVITVQVGGY
jgi:hypothetical protein